MESFIEKISLFYGSLKKIQIPGKIVLVNLIEHWIYWSYKSQILVLYYTTKTPLDSGYLFIFFLGFYGRCLGSVSCFLQMVSYFTSLYIMVTSIFVFATL